MDRHHIVPQFLLRRFANKDGRLRVIDRTNLVSPHMTSVTKACREAGYYRIESEDLEEWARHGHNPELVEKTLSSIEADAAEIITNIICESVHTTQDDRFHLALFVALQMTRGWQFREELNQIGTLRMREELGSQHEELAVRARTWLRRQGRPAKLDDVEKFLESVLGPSGPRLVINDPVRVQVSLGHGGLFTGNSIKLQGNDGRDRLDETGERSPVVYVEDSPGLQISDGPLD